MLLFKQLKKNKTEMPFFYSIGPKIGTSVAPPSRKSTEHGLTYVNETSLQVNMDQLPLSRNHVSWMTVIFPSTDLSNQ